MTPTPAPVARLAGVGVDCEALARWRDLLPALRRPPQDRLFAAAEHAYCSSAPDPVVAYAECWCAKEAVVKASSGFLRLVPREVLVRRDTAGRVVEVWARTPIPVVLPVTVAFARSADTVFAVALAQTAHPPG